MSESSKRGGLFWSFGNALRGLAYLLRTQGNARIHAAITVAVFVTGFVVGLSSGEWCWIVLATVLVWATEALNTALECLADALHPEQHPLVGRAKDVAAGAVLISVFGAVAIGVLVLGPYLWEVLGW